jgi:hypothetical protein
MQDAAHRAPTGSPDFLAGFHAAAFGQRQSLYRAGRSHPLVRARLRARLDHLVELERVRLTDELVSGGHGLAVAALLSQQLNLLSPAQRVGICLCSRAAGHCSKFAPWEGSTPSPSTPRRRVAAAPAGV